MFSRIPNLRIFSRNVSYFLLRKGRILLLKSKNDSMDNLFSKRRHFEGTEKNS